MIDFDNKILDYKKLVENALPNFLPSEDIPQVEVVKAMKYSLCGGGKRIRGTLTISFYELFTGEDISNVLPFVAAAEMVHAYSLIHDDLPCMDDDDLRRGKPSCHIKFGESTALLAGDALLTRAFEITTDFKNISDLKPSLVLEAISIFSKAVGAYGMIGGQILDLANEGKIATVDEVENTEIKKTGELIAASSLLGAIIGGANKEEQKLVREFGINLGLAFQIIDDILDSTSNPEILGKPIGSDLFNNKTTFTSFYGLEKSKELAKEKTENAIQALKKLNKNTAFLEYFTKLQVNRTY